MGVIIFETRNSRYIVDSITQTVSGGKLRSPQRYARGAKVIVGEPAEFKFVDNFGNQLYTRDGRPAGMTTGVVQRIL